MKQITSKNNLVKNARKGNTTEMYGSGLVHEFSLYKDKDTNKEYLVDINITDTQNVKVHSIEEIINEG